jgi:hypothetical protein
MISDPSRCYGLLQATWASESADNKGRFVEALADGRSLAVESAMLRDAIARKPPAGSALELILFSFFVSRASVSFLLRCWGRSSMAVACTRLERASRARRIRFG